MKSNIIVSGGLLIPIFEDFIKSSKVMFNFKLNDKLDIQILEDYTANCSVKYKSLLGDTKGDISFWGNSTLLIFDKDKDIEIDITDADITFKQDYSLCTYTREYEERREYPEINKDTLRPAFTKRLKYLIGSTVSCLPLSKELSIASPDPIFANNKYYVDFVQTVFVEHMEYPELCIGLSILRSFISKLNDNAKYSYLKENNTIYFEGGEYKFYIPTSNYNIAGNFISSIDKIMAELSDVTEINFDNDLNKLEILASAFPKRKMNFIIGQNCFNITISFTNSHVSIGTPINDYLVSLEITSAQLSTILKLFKGDGNIQIKKGANCICLTKDEKNLLIAGMLY